MADQANKIKKLITKEHFQTLAADPFYLSKSRFKALLNLRYGTHLAEKLQSVLNFTTSLDYNNFLT